MEKINKFVLSNEDRKEFRRIVAEKLKDVEFNPEKRIQLDEETLEYLLFDDVCQSYERKFAYTYDGLCKLDLRSVVFEDVTFESKEYKNLSDTNIDIHFDELLFVGQDELKFTNVNFTNVDLSEACNSNDFESNGTSITFDGCILKGTKLDVKKLNNAKFINCDLSELESLFHAHLWNDGTDKLINTDLARESLTFVNCNLSNTRAYINLMCHFDETGSEVLPYDFVGHLISKKYLDGCYVNKTPIKPTEENRKKAEKLLEEYKKYKREKLNETIETINSQVISSSGGRQLNLKRITENSEEENGKN